MLPIHRVKHSIFNYDEIPAGYYHQAMLSGRAPQRFWHRQKFQEVAARIPDGAQVLDLGCGPGSFLHVLTELKPHASAIGIDIASRQIRYARNFFKSHHANAKVKFQILNEDHPELPFKDNSFDVITCIEVIEHIHPFLAAQMLKEARRVLKPEGHLLITTPNYRSAWPLIKKVLEFASPVKYHDQHISKFTPNAFVKFLELSGFELIELRTIFVAAPFLAEISENLARRVLKIEKRLMPMTGNILLAEAKRIPGLTSTAPSEHDKAG